MIRVRGLSKTYPDGKRALQPLDLEVGEGMLGLLGPNGSGKTTLLSMLVLALEPSTGERRYGDLDPHRRRDRREIRRAIGYLPQDFSPIGHLTGLEYLLHCARLRQISGSRRELHQLVRDLLDAVGLTDAAHRRTHGYSGGMKRRLGIAQALIHRPRLLVVDEPTAGLDPEERIRFRQLVTEVSEQTAVLLSTHIVEDIEATCSRIVILAWSRLLFDGTATELLTMCVDRLWEAPDDGTPSEHRRVLARRADPRGGSTVITYADEPPAKARPVEPTLEYAYAAYVSRQAQAVTTEDLQA